MARFCGRPPVAINDDIGIKAAQFVGLDIGVVARLDAEPLALSGAPVGDADQFLAALDLGRDADLAAGIARRFEENDVMAARG